MKMERIKEFDLLNSPLEGTNLIEASAGTGKTYTIANLFLRLLVEKSLTIDQILVVTFTEAATGELKERIRTRIKQALETFSLGNSEDSFLNELVERQKSPALSLQVLREALRSFDQAAIFTIHGFCLRILQENAFESGSLFNTELITEQENIKKEIIEDFWRSHLYHASPLFVHYAINQKLSLKKLLALLGSRIDRPYHEIIPEAKIPESSSLEKEYQACFEEARRTWNKARAEVENILRSHEGLKKDYAKNISAWIQNMDQFLSSGTNKLISSKAYNKFTSTELKRSVKKNYSLPEHPFFKLCDNLKEKQQELEKAFEQQVVGLKYKLFNYVKEELKRRKEARNVQSFDDLLVRLKQALSEEGGEELARAIRSKFKAALIDEFQDTDPIQYDIFKRVFSKGKSILFLIGDPKQAIYGFRGADVFTYLDAVSQVKNRYTLKENWRSEPDLITAINTIFGNKDYPFVHEEIKFHSARPAEKQELEVLRLDEIPKQPLQLWFLNADRLAERGKSITKSQAREVIFNVVAGEIAKLLNLSRKNKAFLGNRPLREGDIAVLVRKNVEARMMQKALSALDVHSVLYSTESLFETFEALEMERIIAAIVEPNNEVLIRVALSTEMIGVKGEELENLLMDDTSWDKWLIKFRDYHNLWNERGFIVMFRRLLAELAVLPRLMSLPGGERRTTNVLHLTEVLHKVSIDRKLAMTGLLNWLSEQRANDIERKEEYQLRLESDENAVNLVTIHKSKGLEYPVVFCPFTWEGSKLPETADLVEFHSKENNWQLTLDLGSKEKGRHRILAEKERLAENLRLFYVALTRAKNRCYLVWGRFNEAETSAPAYLLYHLDSKDEENIIELMANKLKALGDEDFLSPLVELEKKSAGTLRVAEMPNKVDEKYLRVEVKKGDLSYRKFPGKVDHKWQVSSFSYLISGKSHLIEREDRDAMILPEIDKQESFPEATAREEEPQGIFSFPKGTKAGRLFHDIFEHLSFTQNNSSQIKSLVADKLKEYGFELTWVEIIYEMVQKILSTSLELEDKNLKLSCIRDEDRINELEFYFPLKLISREKLRTLFGQYAESLSHPEFPERIEGLDFSPTKGFMKGFIDMVFQYQGQFYLVDWKSNYLGNAVEDYGHEKLKEVMKNEFYVLQYHIYSVALHQYLKSRIPDYDYERHFGKVYYIFLRGVDPDWGPEYGIYRDRPSGELIEALCESLIVKDKRINHE